MLFKSNRQIDFKVSKFLRACPLVLTLAACAVTPPPSSSAFNIQPNTIKRSFVDGLYGQTAIRMAGKDTNDTSPLVLFHPTPYSSQFFIPFMKQMQSDRLVIAMDTPGYGDSSTPDSPPSIEDYTKNALLALDELGITEPVDLVGFHTGVLIALEMSLEAPERVHKIVVAGAPIYPPDTLIEKYKQYAKPNVLKRDGSHLKSVWEFATQTMKDGLSLEGAQAHFSDYMQSLPHSTQAYYGVFSYPGYEKLPQISRPVLYLAVDGSLNTETQVAQSLTPGSDLRTLENIEGGLFDAYSPEVAEISRHYFDRDSTPKN